MIDLSILVCSTHTRYATFGRAIQDQLWGQYTALPPELQDRVEIMIMVDNKKMMLGEKRNVMVDASHGRYIQFVDDDDRVAPDMIETVLEATDHGTDVITFLAEVTINGGPSKPCRYSLDYRRDVNTDALYCRLPNHICAVRSDLAKRSAFPSLIRGEDSGYAKALRPLLKTEHHIPRVLYFYDYSDETSETQTKISPPIRIRTVKPIADLVIMSDGRLASLRRMTQAAIDSALTGANSLPVRPIVVESQPRIKYQHAETMHRPGPFNYNAAANMAIAQGSAEWIVVANNDLRFDDGWLHGLISAGHPVVSPINPGDERQAGIESNQTGTINGRHFSGWCFAMERQLWERIGGLDDRVSFWCSDDATIEQCVAVGVEPMIVVDSVVRHRASATLRSAGRRDAELTWGQVKIFNALYARTKFVDDPRYQAYLRRVGA